MTPCQKTSLRVKHVQSQQFKMFGNPTKSTKDEENEKRGRGGDTKS